jgi:predicted XRE-type DNA-binding protein
MNGIGDNFDDFMIEQGLYDEAKEISMKKLIVLKLKQEMEAQNLSKSNIAKMMRTTRVAVDNILNPDYNTSIGTLERFASVLGKTIHIFVQ